MLTLPPVEPLTPYAAARAAGVSYQWLLRQLDAEMIPGVDYVGSGDTARPVILSSNVPDLAERYDKYRENLKAMRDRQNAARRAAA